MKPPFAAALAASVALVAMAAPARADALQQQILAQAKALGPDAFAFTRTMSVQQTGNERRAQVDRYDPAATPRWTLATLNGAAPPAKDAERYAKSAPKQPVPGYHRIAAWFGAPATRVAEEPGRVTFRFARLPKGFFDINGHDLSADTVAEAVVNTAGPVPFVERTSFVSAKPFRMMMVAKVERVEAGSRFKLVDGKPAMVENRFTMTGSMMGKSGSMTQVATFTDHKPAKAAAPRG
jgi:hypothetical protein